MSYNAKGRAKLKTLTMSHAEFSAIPKVGSTEDVQTHIENGVERVACRGDRGACFVCYPKLNQVYLVKFTSPRNAPQTGLASPGVTQAIQSAIAFRERK